MISNLLKQTIMETKMTLRDYFAGKVLEGIFSNEDMWKSMHDNIEYFTRDKKKDTIYNYVAQTCYKMADAMLKERELSQKR